MKHIVTGIVAHVDAGKTTLSEALLYRSGELRQLGRVDNGDAFLDSDVLEKQRGITIFSHQANLQYQDLAITLLDTPGHVDFASQTEQVLSVLDYAILVVAATDGIQGYTQTLWHLLERYQVPTFVFVNKMDAPGVDKTAVLEQLQAVLSPGILEVETMTEEVALQNEAVLDDYLAQGELPDATIRRMIQRRQVFPVYFGAALKLDGVDDFLAGFNRWTNEATGEAEFGARVFKISHDDKGERLTWVRVTGGELATKAMILPDQKINQLRQYNGEKYTVVPNVMAGQICVIPGLEATYPGQGLGALADAKAPFMQPVLNYALDPKDNDIHACLAALRQLEDEDPQLHVMWSSQLQELRVQIMGPIQLEVLQQLLLTRFDLDVAFGEGSILYKETITAPIEGVGHFEPLRHYAEVHLLLQPAAVGSGLTFDADVPVDVLGKNWQHQVLSSLGAKEHLGVLTGSPITDMRVTLVNGRANNVHSVGGDFREATWRALRQGLMMAKVTDTAQLLEPWYQFRLVVAPDQIGRAMTDVQRMSGQFDAPETTASNAVLTGTAPVSEMQDYAREVQAYTHGQGQLELVVAGYQPCHNAEEVIESRAYNPTGDVANTPDSVFCAHGAGYPVAWNQVPEAAHVAYFDS
ncbi:elongation factor G [Lacticaseibacillus saniviri]|uniref:Translation elongation factor (GTPase) n=1 Tax=Lacticaseibacillus saniviri JCM 17471 = DSM 24301 TaxID=1293598 RepID=A0A0R2MW65_9LACO|nr:TetM/TetW/TetO/TetS family tetracycline resistance ribosomal protection protein [Lacticaseibacillus saniviri]KRO17734.1 translation elongation factor (GTPase) [Lacticaseibacillus saniviri JCM 17471 = DSM 24301]MCG4281375.1 TetM/TetW/TetO/TetS family tetracycline resistance ribosomal protection protein [Lacticaseibacillus saniviri]